MSIIDSPIYLSTALLEKNRWNGKGPSLLVSDWVERIAEAGFAGLEIWMNHLFFASRSEWDLIREMAADADLSLALISSAIPADASEKSAKLREALLEACAYFRPGGLKFTLAVSHKGKGSASTTDKLAFVKEWARAVPRDIGLLFDGGGESDLEPLETARKLLGEDRYRGVLHPFLASGRELMAALDKGGDFVSNLGVQAKQVERWILLSENAAEHMRVLRAARFGGFKGTWSLEYTKGTGLPGEDMEEMFDNAERDLLFLTDALAGN